MSPAVIHNVTLSFCWTSLPTHSCQQIPSAFVPERRSNIGRRKGVGEHLDRQSTDVISSVSCSSIALHSCTVWYPSQLPLDTAKSNHSTGIRLRRLQTPSVKRERRRAALVLPRNRS